VTSGDHHLRQGHGGPLLALARALVTGGWSSHDIELIAAGRELEARAQAILSGNRPGGDRGPGYADSHGTTS
jgi:hypothetical protein